METRSPKWKWFSLGCAVSFVLSILGSYYLISDKLAQSATDPALAPPPLAVGASVLMTFFSLLIPAISLCGLVIVIVDGYSRKAR
jgi:hypothetical protein